MMNGNTAPSKSRSSGKRRAGPILLHAVLFITLAVFVAPFVWVLQTSIKPSTEIVKSPPKWWPVNMSPAEYAAALEETPPVEKGAPGEKSEAALEISGEPRTEAAKPAVKAPRKLTPFEARYGFAPTLEHYRRVFQDYPFIRWIGNTLFIVVFSTLGTLISCAMAAYAFARLRWADRKLAFTIILGTMMLPYQVTLIPMFILFRELHWIDTSLPLIVPAFFGSAFFIFLLRQFFMTLPEELLEAARIDGAGEFFILARIVAPLSKPALLTVVVFSAMWAWNDFLGPLIYLSSEEQKTLALGLQSMVSQFGTEWGLFMAAAAIMIVPILILFFFAQRYFIEGIALTGLKG